MTVGDAVSSTESRKSDDSSTHALAEARICEADSSVAASSADGEEGRGPVVAVVNPSNAPSIGPAG